MELTRTYRVNRSSSIAVIGLLAIGAYTSGLLVLMTRTSFDIWWAAVLAPALFFLTLPMLRRQATREADPSAFRLLVLALVVKLAGAFLRYYGAVLFYGGLSDATVYGKFGAQIAANFRHGHFTTGLKSLSGTDFIRFFTGIVYTATGTSRLGGCVVYSWLGFLGLFGFYRAFRIAVPEGRRSYAYLLFFLPSLVFWPSSIGKDAWMMLTMGVAAYGIAVCLTRWTIRGAVAVVMGLWLASIVRPHVAALMAVAFVVALVTRKSREELRELAPLLKGASVVLAVVLALGLAVKTSHSLNLTVGGGLGSALTSIEDRTSKGGSDFTPALADSPVRFPIATVTVLFRPFVFEAHNTQARIAALESTLLMGLCLVRFRWIVAAFRSLRRQPYVVFCVVYVLLFIIAFSSFANFGLLARERDQLYPLFLVLIDDPAGHRQAPPHADPSRSPSRSRCERPRRPDAAGRRRGRRAAPPPLFGSGRPGGPARRQRLAARVVAPGHDGRPGGRACAGRTPSRAGARRRRDRGHRRRGPGGTGDRRRSAAGSVRVPERDRRVLRSGGRGGDDGRRRGAPDAGARARDRRGAGFGVAAAKDSSTAGASLLVIAVAMVAFGGIRAARASIGVSAALVLLVLAGTIALGAGYHPGDDDAIIRALSERRVVLWRQSLKIMGRRPGGVGPGRFARSTALRSATRTSAGPTTSSCRRASSSGGPGSRCWCWCSGGGSPASGCCPPPTS